MTKAPDVAEPVIGRAFARPVGSSGLRAHVRFTAKATELLRRREMTRCAKLGNGSRRKIALHCEPKAHFLLDPDRLSSRCPKAYLG
jgi:hypothetical protein